MHNATTAGIQNTANDKLAGIWQGWMGYDAHIDVKVAIVITSDDNIMVDFAQGDENNGRHNSKAIVNLHGDLLLGYDANGSILFLELRPDGYMNIGRQHNANTCTGVLKQIQRLPVAL